MVYRRDGLFSLAGESVGKGKEDTTVSTKELEKVFKKFQGKKEQGNRESLTREKNDQTRKELEEQTKLLKDIARGSRGGRGRKGGKVNGLVGGAIGGAIFSALKKTRFLPLAIGAYLLSSKDRVKKEMNKLASKQGVDVENLGLGTRLRAVTNVIFKDTASVINKGLKLLGIDAKIDENFMSDLTADISSKIDSTITNIRNNTGAFGNGLLDFLSKTDDILGSTVGKALSNIDKSISFLSDYAKEVGDIGLNQTADHKKFISLVKKMRSIKGLNGVVDEKDMALYQKTQNEAKKVAGRLQSNSVFTSQSGYQDEATALLDPKSLAKINADNAKRKVDFRNGFLGFMSSASSEDLTDYKNKRKKYLEIGAKDGSLSKKEQKEYNQIMKDKNAKHLELKNKILTTQKEIEAMENTKELLIKDTAHRSQLVGNIKNLAEEIEKASDKLKGLNISLEENPLTNPVTANIGDISLNDKNFLAYLGKTESNNNYFAKPNKSGYEGKYQFRYREKGDHGTMLLKKLGITKEQVRQSPELQEKVMQTALAEYKKDLKGKNLPVNNYTLWLRHNQGAGGASQIMRNKSLTPTVRHNMLEQFGAKKGRMATLSDSAIIQAYHNKFQPKFTTAPSKANKQSNTHTTVTTTPQNNTDVISAINAQTEEIKKANNKKKPSKEKVVVAFSPTEAYKDIR